MPGLVLGAALVWVGWQDAAGATMPGAVAGLPDSPGQVVMGGTTVVAGVATTRPGTITGMVSDTDKAAIAGAQVTVEGVSAREVERQITRDKGSDADKLAERQAAKEAERDLEKDVELELEQRAQSAARGEAEPIEAGVMSEQGEPAKAETKIETRVEAKVEAVERFSRTVTADGAGEFRFEGLLPGHFRVSIHAPGFASWKVEEIEVRAGETVTLPPILLGVEEITSTVRAIFKEDLAEEQISAEEKQRILGVLPNFYVSYLSDAVSLTRKQKFKLAFRISRDSVTLAKTALVAGIEQAQGDFSGYGPGFPGYAKRYGATYGGNVSSTMLGAAIFPSLFKQDPRYFYNGKGSVTHRALYAIATVVICKGDNGKWQPNYSNVLGNLGAGAITSLYYPKSDQKSMQVTLDNALIGTAEGAFGTLFQEFLLRRFTHGAPKAATP
jgi:hypothetical protein